MPELTQSLQGHDLGFLRILAELWGIELEAPDVKVGLQRLIPLMLKCEVLEEVLESLPREAREALVDLTRNDGRIAWSLFARRYGIVREMGIARRDRKQPYLASNSTATESLWYRGLVSRKFFNTITGPEEFAFIPEDLLALMPTVEKNLMPPLGRHATSAESAYPILSDDSILDETCILLAALRAGIPLAQPNSSIGEIIGYSNDANRTHKEERRELNGSRPILSILKAFLDASGLLDDNGIPLPEPTRLFLEASRDEALVSLVRAWLRSQAFNELQLLFGMSMVGEWKNEPLRARQAVLGFLTTIPGYMTLHADLTERPFWSLSTFLTAIRQHYPDFQRSAGDYDSWYLRDELTGEYLRGFEHWDEVDGALIRFIICGPLFWLGILDLALSESAGFVTAFRFSKWATDLLNLKPPLGMDVEQEKLQLSLDGRINVSRLSPRAARYQIARFCSWERSSPEGYRFVITSGALKSAHQQGLRVQQLLALLRRYAKNTPPNLVKALERWEAQGIETRLERVVLLRVTNAEILQELRSSRVARYLEELLGTNTVVVKANATEKILGILMELGYLGECKIEES